MVPAECAPRSVATGRDHTCSVDHDGRVYCWGLNDSGQTLPGSNAYRILEPSEVSLPSPATQVTAGRAFSCALLDTGATWCWGSNLKGTLGVAPDSALRGPIQVVVPVAVEVSTGGYHACIRTAADGSVWCW